MPRKRKVNLTVDEVQAWCAQNDYILVQRTGAVVLKLTGIMWRGVAPGRFVIEFDQKGLKDLIVETD